MSWTGSQKILRMLESVVAWGGKGLGSDVFNSELRFKTPKVNNWVNLFCGSQKLNGNARSLYFFRRVFTIHHLQYQEDAWSVLMLQLIPSSDLHEQCGIGTWPQWVRQVMATLWMGTPYSFNHGVRESLPSPSLSTWYPADLMRPGYDLRLLSNLIDFCCSFPKFAV